MEASKVITYSLLAQIRNSGNFVNSSVEIFVPIVKYALYKLITQSGVYKGASITEISTWICQYFGLDFPPAVLEKILLKIGQEINTSEELKLQVYRDGSFWIKNYSFEEFNDIYETNRQQVELVQTMFKQFCDINDVKKDSYNTIFDFVNLNKLKISNYLANRDYSVNGSKFSIEAQFVEYFRNIPGCYEVIRKIYLGSILSCYLSEYEPQDKMMSDVELLLDTNFIVSLLDLNTPESTTTCRQLLKIASSFGYSLRVLKETIKETTDLLLKKAEYFDKSFLPKLINPEDIYKACERRNLNRNDLERIADNLENILVDEYSILQIPYTVKYQNLAKSSTEYAEFKKIRNTDFAALHDIMALYYVREKRGKKKIKHFEDVNCWFVNNAINHDNSDYVGYKLRGYQPEIIRADELLCVLWFIKPDIGNGDLTDGVVDTNLNALISCTLNSSLPQASIIKELDDNIQKYKDASISDKDILRIATRITTHQLKNIEELNEIAESDSKQFVQKLKEEADKQKQEDDKRIARFEDVLKKLERLSSKPSDIEVEKRKRFKLINENRERDRNGYIKKQICKWRLKTWYWVGGITVILLVCLACYLVLPSTEGIDCFLQKKSISLIGAFILGVFDLFVIKNLYDKYCNHSNINAFKMNIIVPEELKNLNRIEDMPN
jgi:predicted nucleic acid-binding protein|nr:hypothetical protein [uncultured Alistipes sp.]